MKHFMITFTIILFFIVVLTGNLNSSGTHENNTVKPTRQNFTITANDSRLIYNDGSGRQFFAAGMVDNRPSSGKQLSRYKHNEMDEQLATHARIGASTMRWNTFLKGIDLRWDKQGHVIGMCENAVANIIDGLDLAQKHGVMIQLTLSTGHFLQYGWGGKNKKNIERVNNNKLLFENKKTTASYMENVIKPVTDAVGTHPALFVYLLINEVHAMISPEETPNGSWTDVHVSLKDLQRWVNLVSGTIHDRHPGALISVSTIAKLIPMWSDKALIKAGGNKKGTLDLYQIQFYPTKHLEAWSPFERKASELLKAFGGDLKPVVCGEFPVRGMLKRANKKRTSSPFDLKTAYERLWNNGHSGGFTWSYNVYSGMDSAEKQKVEAAYKNLRDKIPLKNKSLRSRVAPDEVNTYE